MVMTNTFRSGGALRQAPILILLCGGIILSLNLGLRQSFGLFLEPLTTSHAWPRGVFALAMAVQQLMWGLSQPFAGMVADRFGAGRTVAASGLLYALGIALMASATTPSVFTLSAGLLIGVALSGASFGVVLGAVGRSVSPERRGSVLGMTSALGSLGMAIFPLISQGLIGNLGWSTALLISAALALVIVPMAAALKGKSVVAAGGLSLTEAIREAMGHSGFWFLTLGFFVCGFHVAFIATHLPGFVNLCGLPASVGATGLFIIGAFNVAGTLLAGRLGDRFRKKYLLSLIYLLRAVIFGALLLAPKTETTILLFAAGAGLLWLSTVPLTSGLVAQIFGPQYMSTLFGMVFLSHQVGAFFGAWLGGVAFDTWGNYDAMWWASLLLGVLGAALNWPIADTSLRVTAKPAAA